MHSTRRDFARAIGAAATLSRVAPAAPLLNQAAESGDRRLNYAIVGLGRISMSHFMPACKMSQHSKVTAFVSGHREKAEKLAPEYDVPSKNLYSYENYDEIANNKEIDAVYIALPNSMHAEYTIRAAKAGKHVLCEKPMAVTVKESEAMVAACKTANKKLMIAYRCQYEPANLQAVQLIRDGKLGKIQAIESANGFNEKMGEWRLDRKLAGGGPLMDMGIYSLNACRYLTGEEPTHIQANGSVIDKDGRFATVEESVSWTMKFPSGIVASCNTTYGASMPGFYRVYGSDGMISMEPAFGYQGLHLTAKMKGQDPVDFSPSEPDPHQFVVEADHFADCVFNNKEPKANGQEGLRDMKLMAEIYKSAGFRMG